MISDMPKDATNDDLGADVLVLPDGATPEAVSERLGLAVRAAGGHAAVVAKSGVKSRTLSRILGGQEVKQGALVALADACDVTVEWLATGRKPALRAKFCSAEKDADPSVERSEIVHLVATKWPLLRPDDARMISSALSLARTAVHRGPHPVDASLLLSALQEFYEAFTRQELDDTSRMAAIAAISEKYLEHASRAAAKSVEADEDQE